jgi:hypothetical protein
MLKHLVTGLSLWRSVYVGFMVDAVALQQAYLKVHWFYSVTIIAPMLHAHSLICLLVFCIMYIIYICQNNLL